MAERPSFRTGTVQTADCGCVTVLDGTGFVLRTQTCPLCIGKAEKILDALLSAKQLELFPSNATP